ncbi:MAG: zinc ribbon domain-containing protein [Oscillospiraceae bacterium]
MNSNGLVKARNAFLVLQILSSILIIIAAIVSFVSLNELKTNYKSFESFFGAVNLARVGAIITFSLSIITVIIAYFIDFAVGKAAGGAVISTVMFILNFVLVPFSSKESLASSLADRFANSLYNYGSQSLSTDSYSSFYPPMIILLIVSLIMISVVGASLNEQPVDTTTITPPSQSDSWTCPFCNTVNPKLQPICYNCHSIRPSTDEDEPKLSDTKTCTFCGAKLSSSASICWNCKKPYQTDSAQQKPKIKICSYCGAEINCEAIFCEKCGKSTKMPKPVTDAETKSVETEKTNSKTKICKFCGATISADGEFCGKCGKPINPPAPPKKAKTCGFCGAKIPLGNSFCGKCGAEVKSD